VVPSPDNPYGMGGSFVAAMRALSPGGSLTAVRTSDPMNSWGTINPDGSITWHGVTKGRAIQTATIAPRGTSGLSRLAAPVHRQHELQLSVAADPESEPSTPRAQCGSVS
jgi:hypothetical protein